MLKMKKMAAAVLALAMTAGMLAMPGTVRADEYNLDDINEATYVLAHSGSAGSTNDFYGETFRDLLEEKSGGKVSIDIYNASQLGSDVSEAADTQAGVIDFFITSPAAIPNVVPEVAIFDMPFLFNDVESARKVLLDDTLFQGVSDAFLAQDLVLFPLTDQGFRQLTTNHEITGIDSFNGMTLRTMNNEHHIAWWSALGVACTPLNTAEIFLALQQGMLEGQENPWSQAYDKGLYDVQKYITNSNHVFYVSNMCTGKSKWESFTETERQLFWDCAAEAAKIVQEHTDTFENEMLEKLTTEMGMTFVDFDEIPGLREELHNRTFEAAYKSISGAIGTELLDQLIIAAGYGDEIPQ